MNVKGQTKNLKFWIFFGISSQTKLVTFEIVIVIRWSHLEKSPTRLINMGVLTIFMDNTTTIKSVWYLFKKMIASFQ